MGNENKAREVYNSLVAMLNERDWNFAQDDEKMFISASIRGEDLPVEFIMRVMPDYDVVQLRSKLQFNMPEDKRIEGAIATSVANYGMINGSFDYDINDGEVAFRLTTSYTNSVLSYDLLEKMIYVSASTVDRYNDRFFMLAKGMMTLEDFIKKDNE